VSEFLYKPKDTISGFAINRAKFFKIINDPLGKKLIPKIKKNYINTIRTPVAKHREVSARRF
jgi:hypothetical protein